MLHILGIIAAVALLCIMAGAGRQAFFGTLLFVLALSLFAPIFFWGH